ncbi:MAG: serine hydrolase [Bacteroidota bacterium]
MKRKSILLAILTLLLVGIVIGLNLLIPTGAAYSAKILCSSVFVADREAEAVIAKDLGFYSFIWMDVDEVKKQTHASFLGMWKRTAVYREGLGCSLAIGVEADELQARQPEMLSARPAAYDSLLFPMGDRLMVADSFRAQIDFEQLQQGIDQAFVEPDPANPTVNTRAVVVVYDSILVGEKYAEGFDKNTPLLGWSMTKSVTQTMLGILIERGHLALDDSLPFDAWAGENDPRGEISIDQMLRMSSGLAFQEVYLPPADATTMLFESHSASDYALEKGVAYPPDSVWSYSSATSNILSRLVRQTVGEKNYLNFPRQTIFDPLGMRSAVIEPDASGTFVGSSFMYATGRDWARYGMLYLNDGLWNGQRILPEGWVDYTRTPTPKSNGIYGAHFWLNAGLNEMGDERRFPDAPQDVFFPSGFEGQYVFIIPSKRLVVVRLGFTPGRGDFDINAFLREIVKAVK